MSKCCYCGGEYEPTHGNQKYCSKECAAYAKEEQDLKHKLHWYHKNKKRLQETRLGTHNLSPHPNPDPEKEAEIIRYEKKRIGI